MAAKIANMRQGARNDLEPSANLPEVSQTEAADLLNVSERSLRSAKHVLDQGSLTLIDRVQRGALAVSTAAEIATLEQGDNQHTPIGGTSQDQAANLPLDTVTQSEASALLHVGVATTKRAKTVREEAIQVARGYALDAERKMGDLLGREPQLERVTPSDLVGVMGFPY